MATRVGWPALGKWGDRLGDAATVVLVGWLAWRLLMPAPSESIPAMSAPVLPPSGHVTLVELGATYCPACWAMKPIVFALHRHYAGRIDLKVLDVDAPGDRREASRLAEAIHLRATPTMLVVDEHGALRQKFVGATSYASLAGALDQLLPKIPR